LGFVVFRQ